MLGIFINESNISNPYELQVTLVKDRYHSLLCNLAFDDFRLFEREIIVYSVLKMIHSHL